MLAARKCFSLGVVTTDTYRRRSMRKRRRKTSGMRPMSTTKTCSRRRTSTTRWVHKEGLHSFKWSTNTHICCSTPCDESHVKKRPQPKLGIGCTTTPCPCPCTKSVFFVPCPLCSPLLPHTHLNCHLQEGPDYNPGEVSHTSMHARHHSRTHHAMIWARHWACPSHRPTNWE